jgi:hypothetical protein
MNYEKPAVVVLRDATETILGGGKPNFRQADNPKTATPCAYEADE